MNADAIAKIAADAAAAAIAAAMEADKPKGGKGGTKGGKGSGAKATAARKPRGKGGKTATTSYTPTAERRLSLATPNMLYRLNEAGLLSLRAKPSDPILFGTAFDRCGEVLS